MNWTKQFPQVKGYYWALTIENPEPYIVQFKETTQPGELEFYICGWEIEERPSDWLCFYGPLLPPKAEEGLGL